MGLRKVKEYGRGKLTGIISFDVTMRFLQIVADYLYFLTNFADT